MAEVLSLTQLKTRVCDAFSTVTLSKWGHDQLDKRLASIRTEVNRRVGKVKPRLVYGPFPQGFVSGIIQVKMDELYQHHLEFVYIVDGVLYSTSRNTPHRTTQEFYDRHEGHLLAQPGQWSGYVWKGTDKVFFGSIHK